MELSGIARRFPLVARPRPVCPPLDVGVREVGDLARAAASATDTDPLPLAAAAHNRAALIASDCGMPELARSLCWRLHDVYSQMRPLSAQAARFALEPLVNLARLQIRSAGNEEAHQLLDALYHAVMLRADVAIDGTMLSFAGLTDSEEAHRTVCRWLWAVLLAEGTRALTAAGRWEQALAHVERHGGIGLRLLDGRQVAVLARCVGGEPATAFALLGRSATPTTWERCVGSCLAVLCALFDARPADRSVTDMANLYLALQSPLELQVFHARLGLAVLDLAGGADWPAAARTAARVVSQAAAAGDAYVARDVLAHDACSALLTDAEVRMLSETLESSGLGRGSMPAHLLDDLLSAVETADALATRHLRSLR